jgi:integrase
MDRGMLSVSSGTVLLMARGSVEELRSGFRARVYAGKDPITGKQTYLRGQTRRDRGQAEQDCTRLLTQVEAETHPDRSATVATLMQRWIEVVDHELTTRDTTAGYIRRVINPALGDMSLRKLQHRVDIIDRLYTHLRRCSALCDGRPFVEHKSDDPHDCAKLKCRPHACKPLAPGSVRRIHGILSPALGYAVSWGWIERNPAEYAHPPKLKRRRARPPEAEQVARLLNLAWATSVEFAMFLWLATTTGARRGELVGLRWTAVNLQAGIITIEKNYVQRGGQWRWLSVALTRPWRPRSTPARSGNELLPPASIRAFSRMNC